MTPDADASHSHMRLSADVPLTAAQREARVLRHEIKGRLGLISLGADVWGHAPGVPAELRRFLAQVQHEVEQIVPLVNRLRRRRRRRTAPTEPQRA